MLFENIDNKQTDRIFKLISSDQRFIEKKRLLENMYKKFLPYADKNFHDLIMKDFHDRFWEMYLGYYFLENGFELKQKENDRGPDIQIFDPLIVNIEATISTGGKGLDSVKEPEMEKGSQVPHDQICLRYLSSINYKFEKYIKYLEDGTIIKNEPYVIAINGFKVPYKYLGTNPPDIVKSVFAIGNEYLNINIDTGSVNKIGFLYQSSIKKVNDSEVSKTIFQNNRFSGISGIIFSEVDFFHMPEVIGRDLLFIHNPLAKNPLPRGWLKSGREYWAEDSKLFCRLLE